jgi:hypothetical protein
VGSSSTARRGAQISGYAAVLGAFGVALVALVAMGCGTSPVGVGACKQVEEARCRRAPACGVNLEPPYSTTGGDVAACIRFYDVACLHGLAVADPGQEAVNACVASIESSPCDGLPLFEMGSACAWLTKLSGVEAGSSDASDDSADSEGEASDSGSDSASETGSDSASLSDSGSDAAEASLQ